MINFYNKNTEKLFGEVDLMSDYILEQYSPDLKNIRKLGDLTLKVLSRIEELLDQIIIMWIEERGEKVSFADRLKYLMKYNPLLSRMFVSEKTKALLIR
jgi:hypothetical protein